MRLALPSAVVLMTLAAAGASAQTTPTDQQVLEVPDVPGAWQLAGAPIVSYASDVGLTLGAALLVYRPYARHPDALQSAALSFSWATHGPRALDLGWSDPRLLGAPLGAVLNLHLADDPEMPYWGEGAQLGGLSVPPGSGTPPAPYRYHDRRILAAGLLRATLAGPLGAHLRARFLDVDVAGPSALLAASSPPGAGGGRVALLEAGLLYDTRDRSIATHRGVLLSAAGFVAPYVAGLSDFAFHGWDATARGYVQLWPGGTLAARLLYDRKRAGLPWASPGAAHDAVPFFERMLREGIAYGEGLGGAATLRGIARYRVSGDDKAMANVELRARVLQFRMAGRPQELGVDLGLDAGRAQQPGYAAVDGAGAALGVRLVWDEALVARLEVARALAGGDVGIYFSFGEMF